MTLQAAWRWLSRPEGRWGLVAAGGASLVALLIWGGRGGDPGAASGAQQSAVIAAQPFAVTLGITGVIAPGPTVPVVAPFDAIAKRVDIQFGETVTRGQTLVELDTADLAQRRDTALADYLKTAQSADDFAHWDASAEVAQARRSEAQAAMELAETRRKLGETGELLRKGLVARDEYDSLTQQLQGQELALAAARRETAETLKRGAGVNRQAAQLEARSAGARLRELSGGGGAVVAPVAGVLVRPAGDKADSSAAPHVGQSFTRGQMIAAIAPAGSLAVSFSLAEADANRVRVGERVAVTGGGFPGQILGGVVTAIAQEGTAASAGGTVTFPASARLDPLTPAQAAVVRIGMTAAISIELYRNPSALVAPAAAIRGEAPDTYVMVQRRAGEPPVRRAVKIGQVGPAGVEVLAGLKPGDRLVWTAQAGGGDDSDS